MSGDELAVAGMIETRSAAPDPRATALQNAVDRAELSLNCGAPRKAELQLAAMWSDIIRCGVSALVDHARLVRARTRLSQGRLDEAIAELEELLADTPVSDLSARLATGLSYGYRERGDLTQAIAVGDRVLDALRRAELPDSDQTIRLLVTVAGAYALQGDLAHAARLCWRAAQRAERLDSPLARASAYWNASVVESFRGAVDAAVPRAAWALQLMETTERRLDVAQLRTWLAGLLLKLDDPEIEQARANLDAGQEQMQHVNVSPLDRGRHALAVAHAELLSGDIGAAETRALSVLQRFRGASALTCAEALMLVGRAAAARGDGDGAASYYREVVLQLTGVGADRAAAQAWFELGSLYDGLGCEREARDAYRRAAVSTGLRSPFGAQRTRLRGP